VREKKIEKRKQEEANIN